MLKNYLSVNKKMKFIKQSSDATAVRAFNPYIKSLKPKLYFGRKEELGKTPRSGSHEEKGEEGGKRKVSKKKKRIE